MNVRLLRKIAKVIQEKPREFSIVTWHRNKSVGFDKAILYEVPEEKRVSCRTTHCIAGWAQVLSPDHNCHEAAPDDAQRLLGITDYEASRLFYGYNWPKGFGGLRANAKQAAARIEHFIKTKGAE